MAVIASVGESSEKEAERRGEERLFPLEVAYNVHREPPWVSFRADPQLKPISKGIVQVSLKR